MAVFPRGKAVTVAAIVAVVFGIATVAAGSRVLLGSDPGYTVFRPLLLFNTAMGFAYMVVGVLAWRRSALGARGAAVIALLNLTVFAAIALLYAGARPIAVTSLQAMAFRTVVWIVLFVVLLRSGRRQALGGRDAV